MAIWPEVSITTTESVAASGTQAKQPEAQVTVLVPLAVRVDDAVFVDVSVEVPVAVTEGEFVGVALSESVAVGLGRVLVAVAVEGVAPDAVGEGEGVGLDADVPERVSDCVALGEGLAVRVADAVPGPAEVAEAVGVRHGLQVLVAEKLATYVGEGAEVRVGVGRRLL